MRHLLVGALLCASSSIVALAAPAQALPTTCDELEIMAHRGYHVSGIDENSLRSFDEAAARGYTIETDVWSDAEGQLWIFHDRNVFRATGGTGLIDQMTTEQVAALRYRKGGAALPRFEEAIAAWSKYPETRIYLEPKQLEIMPEIIRQFREAGLVDNVYFTGYTAYINNNHPDFGTAPKSFASVPDPATFVAQGVDAVMFGQSQMTSERVDEYHAAGLEVQEKTTNSTTEWRASIAKGFDSILTDFPDDLKAFCPVALAPAVIDSFSPGKAKVGASVTLSGSNFTDASRVSFGGVNASFTLNSASSITTVVPSGAPASSNIRVTTPNGTSSSELTFDVAVPEITTFTPDMGGPGDVVTIQGQNFSDATAVHFGDLAAEHFVVDSDTQITATSPPSLTGSAAIKVTTPSGVGQSAQAFVVEGLAVTALSPSRGPAGGAVTLEGHQLADVTSVSFGGVIAEEFTINSEDQVTAVVPDGAPRVALVTVATPAASADSPSAFTVTPGLSSFSPGTGDSGSTVSLFGTHLDQVSQVRFGSADADFTVISPSEISAIVPADAPARARIHVRDAYGAAMSNAPFRVAPVITGFTPESGLVGDMVEISGRNLNDALSVKFGPVDAASFEVVSPTLVRAEVPTGAPARAKIQVRTPGGAVLSSTTYRIPPVIDGLSPSRGPVGTVVVIEGQNLATATRVLFGAVPATSYTVVSPTRIEAVAPDGAPSSAVLRVRTPGGLALSASRFDYE